MSKINTHLFNPEINSAERIPPRHLIDGVLMGLFIVRIALPGLPVALPFGDIAAGLLVVLALLRPKTTSVNALGKYTFFCIFIILYLVATSLVNDVDFARRLIKIIIMLMLAGVIAAGRVDIVSGLRGLGIALSLNMALYYFGLAPDDAYEGYLTGFLGDKNIAGLYYAVIPLLLIIVVNQRWLKVAILLAAGAAVFLTGSRSSLAALGFALVWLFLAKRLNTFGKLSLATVLLFIYQFVNDNFAQSAIFGDRTGTDLLRARIDSYALAKTESAPWYGFGLGEGEVFILNKLWFFHNSYLALIVEGGIVLLISMVGLYAIVGLRLFQPKINDLRPRVIEATTVAFLLCALRLGEVFFTLPGFIIIGIGLLIMVEFSKAKKAPPLSGSS